jgi:hypothetical protein
MMLATYKVNDPSGIQLHLLPVHHDRIFPSQGRSEYRMCTICMGCGSEVTEWFPA